MSAKNILLAVAEEPFRVALVEQLELQEEFTIVPVLSGRAVIDKTKSTYFDLILLDINPDDLGDPQVCKKLRKTDVKCPIIIFISPENDPNNNWFLGIGATDYVVKPFKFVTLLSRIRSHIHQHERSEKAEFSVGPYIFRPSVRQLFQNESNIYLRLTDKETSILTFLYRANNKAVSRDVLLNEVWGYNSEVTTHTLETHIYRLRRKIESDPSSAKILVTEPGGYRLVSQGPDFSSSETNLE